MSLSDEVNKMPSAELFMACLLLSGIGVKSLITLGLSLPPPLESDFARAIVNAPVEANEEMVLKTARDLLQAEYPDFFYYMEGIYYGNHA